MKVSPSAANRVIVLEGREALGEVASASIEAAVHAINSFVRSPSGVETLVVWPVNTDELAHLLVESARPLGGEALLGLDDEIVRFSGPPRSEFVHIADKTVTALNEGATLAALGISDARASELVEKASTIGKYLGLIRKDLLSNARRVRKLLSSERYRLWTIVIAGNEPEGDVAALTRGRFALVDIDRLMIATGANVVSSLKENSDQIGILGTVLDARIIYLDIVTALAVARRYGNEQLHDEMRKRNMSISGGKAADRLKESHLGVLLSDGSLGTRRRGSKPGSNTLKSFADLAQIARKKDGLLNDSIGNGLVEAGLIESYETERALGTVLRFHSDVFCTMPEGDPIRIEIMWRTQTSRAEIANYVLSKLRNYGKAIGLLKAAS
jgi:hypothetical protein